ncbi:M81 family metallopeptidase [Ensifer sp. ENS06]|uniref:M81 family metallopeptidase n=1 Tax=Ensifer sp. ENS06 TaxID=2769276 RepID=UPI000DDE8DC7|nr:M81 family metallopeptidase [Ensifer sp. ENS06]MBD9625010.1 M81 family metallopeptidase [Ensifer sp. ENS06]
MRIVIARLNHETNTFSPIPTPLAAFRPIWGEHALKEARGMKAALGAFHTYAEYVGAEVACPLIAHAWPSGPVDDSAFEAMSAAILADVSKGCDMILLDLHGAMVTQSHDDGEGELLMRVRNAAPGVPIGVALDLHGNITKRMIENCDAIAGFKTYPHVDMFETGELVCSIMERIRLGEPRPRMALAQPPLIAHTLAMNTTVPGAMAEVIDCAVQAEKQPGVLAVSFFGGFPAADIHEAGASIVAVTESHLNPVNVADDVARQAWMRRQGFVYDQKPLGQSITLARAAADRSGMGPILLLDHGDNCMSGGTCENMDVLQAALKAGLTGVVAGPINDRGAVAQAFAAGLGADIEIDVGNKIFADGFPPPSPPLRLKGRVSALGDGRYTISGPIYTGMVCDMGRSAVIDTGTARVLISEETHEPWDQAVFTSLGIEPQSANYLILKSRMYCRPVFEPLAKAVIECAGGGVTGSNYSLFPFRKLRRPIYPIDADATWEQPDG